MNFLAGIAIATKRAEPRGIIGWGLVDRQSEAGSTQVFASQAGGRHLGLGRSVLASASVSETTGVKVAVSCLT